LFAALDLDDATRRRLVKVARDLQRVPGVKWTKPEALHVTLRFFGEWPEERLPELIAALGSVEPPEAVEIRLTGLSFLPGAHKPRVFIAVGETPKPLAEFQHRIEEAARTLGFEPENRGFITHVTLGRIRDPRHGKKVVAAVTEYQVDLGAFTADHWTLYSSELTPQGSTYKSLAQWPFAPPRSPNLDEEIL